MTIGLERGADGFQQQLILAGPIAAGETVKIVMTTKKRNSRILDEMHETARGLQSAGLISKRRMGEFEALWNAGECRKRLGRHQLSSIT